MPPICSLRACGSPEGPRGGGHGGPEPPLTLSCPQQDGAEGQGAVHRAQEVQHGPREGQRGARRGCTQGHRSSSSPALLAGGLEGAPVPKDGLLPCCGSPSRDSHRRPLPAQGCGLQGPEPALSLSPSLSLSQPGPAHTPPQAAAPLGEQVGPDSRRQTLGPWGHLACFLPFGFSSIFFLTFMR